MDGVHHAGQDADLLVQHLDQRRQAIGGAGCIRDHRVAGFEHAVIDAVHDGRIDVVAARGGNHDFFRARRDVRRRLGLAGEQARALQHEIHAELAPGQLGRIALRDHADAIAVHHHRIAVDVHIAAEAAVHGVETRQMSIGIGIAQVVDRDDLDLARVLALVERAQNVAADAPVTIDPHFDCHRLLSSSLV